LRDTTEKKELKGELLSRHEKTGKDSKFLALGVKKKKKTKKKIKKKHKKKKQKPKKKEKQTVGVVSCSQAAEIRGT